MNEQNTPWFFRQSTLKTLTLLSWITHVFSMVAVFRFMPIWVPIICIVLYVLLEKYVGYFVDVFAFIISIIYSAGWLIAVLLIGLIYPWVLNYVVRVSIIKFMSKSTQEDEFQED